MRWRLDTRGKLLEARHIDHLLSCEKVDNGSVALILVKVITYICFS